MSNPIAQVAKTAIKTNNRIVGHNLSILQKKNKENKNYLLLGNLNTTKRLVTRIKPCLAESESNFRLADQALIFNLKNHWKILKKYNAEPQKGEAYQLNNSKSIVWRNLLDEIRTHFEENPEEE